MAQEGNLSLNYNIGQDLETGQLLQLSDTTGAYSASNTGGYGSPNIAKSAITATRLTFTEYYAEQAAGGVDSLEPQVEYILTSANTFTLDTAPFVKQEVGSSNTHPTFISFVDQTVDADTYTISTTGGRRIDLTNTYLPTQAYVNITPSEMGYDDGSIFIDTVMAITYEVYKDFDDGTDDIVAGITYMAGDDTDPDGGIEYAGNSYRVGEVFTPTAAQVASYGNNYNTIGLTSVLRTMVGTISTPFTTRYNSYYNLVTVQSKLASNQFRYAIPNVQDKVAIMASDFESLENVVRAGYVDANTAIALIEKMARDYTDLTTVFVGN